MVTLSGLPSSHGILHIFVAPKNHTPQLHIPTSHWQHMETPQTTPKHWGYAALWEFKVSHFLTVPVDPKLEFRWEIEKDFGYYAPLAFSKRSGYSGETWWNIATLLGRFVTLSEGEQKVQYMWLQVETTVWPCSLKKKKKMMMMPANWLSWTDRIVFPVGSRKKKPWALQFALNHARWVEDLKLSLSQSIMIYLPEFWSGL